jgi:hypothetical protein
MISFRRIGTKWQIAKIPPLYTRTNTYLPTRREFLIRQTIILIAAFTFADLCHSLTDTNQPQHYSRGKEYIIPRLPSMTYAGIWFVMRTELIFIFGFAAIVQISYSGCALLFVGLGITDHDSWRPCLGNVTDLYTIRNAWG